jgi:hypothetical protein
MSNNACATLILRTSDISSTPSTVGSSNTNKSQLGWININLRTLLGDLYDKYDTFNLCLNSISCSTPAEALGADYGNDDINNLNHLVSIGGLPFINQTYSQSLRCNSNLAPLGVFIYPSATTTVGYRVYNDSGILTFGKSQEQCNININLTRVSDGASPVSTNAFPSTIFMFSIVGVDKKDSNNGSRI